MHLAAAVLSGFALASAAPWLERITRRASGWIIALLPLGLLLFFLAQAPAVAAGMPISVSYAWAPELGLRFSLRLDGLGLLLAILITGIGALILIYAGPYMAGHPLRGRFFAFMLLFMASMLGLVLADNLLLLYVFWELTTVSSWLLIGFENEKPEARNAAWQALVVTAAGGLALLAGLVLLGQIAGTYELSEILQRGPAIQSSPLYLPALLLVAAGAFVKSAQAPFHFWLPNAMTAPTPVSAYLHSATMVKAGVYLLARMSPALGDTPAWTGLVGAVGATTMLLGAWLAVIQTDLKRILAYSTISALGMMVLMLGLAGRAAATAAVTFLFAHALYKGAMFMVAGAVDHEAGSRDATQLRGLRRAMPLTTTAAWLALLSMVGLPPTLGYIGHELFLEATAHSYDPAGALLLAGATAASTLYVMAAGLVAVRPFLGPRIHAPREHPHEAPPGLWLGPLLLGAAGLLAALWPQALAHALIAPAASSILGQSVAADLGLWHGLTLPFILGMLAIAAGAALYALSDSIRHAARRLRIIARFGPDRAYETLNRAVQNSAAAMVRALQNGYLPIYIGVAAATTLGATAYALLARAHADWALAHSPPRSYEIMLGILTLAAALGAAIATSRLIAVACMSIVGYSVAVFFILFSAPDLTITQFLVETLFVVLVVLLLPGLPRLHRLASRSATAITATLAIAGGSLVAALILAIAHAPPDPSVIDYYASHSKTEAHGRNIVNVILVDFRSLDTLGEITVLCLAALGVHVLLRPRGRHPKEPPQ